jgi:hypothetical protein
MIYLIGFLAFMVLMALGNHSNKNQAVYLSRRFARLGNMYGKSKSEIIKAVGEPTSRSYMGRTQLLQWQCPGYHIALQFDDHEMFAGITHEYAAR